MTDRELLLSGVDPRSVVDLVERWVQLGGGDVHSVIVVEVEATVEGLVELAAGVVVGVAVEAGGVCEEGDAFGEPLCSDHELGAGVGEVGLDAGSFELDVVGACLDFCFAELAVGGEVDEPFFADFEFCELRGQGRVQVGGELLVFGHGGGQLGGDCFGEAVGDLQGGVGGADCFLYLGNGKVR